MTSPALGFMPASKASQTTGLECRGGGFLGPVPDRDGTLGLEFSYSERHRVFAAQSIPRVHVFGGRDHWVWFTDIDAVEDESFDRQRWSGLGIDFGSEVLHGTVNGGPDSMKLVPENWSRLFAIETPLLELVARGALGGCVRCGQWQRACLCSGSSPR